MKEEELKIEKYLENPRTRFIAEEYKKTFEREKESEELKDDLEMSEMVDLEIAEILELREDLKKQILEIEEKEKEEEEFPNELILEIRAAAGGDEASLFAGEVALMYQSYARKQN